MSDSIARLRAEFLSETEDTLANLHQDLKSMAAARDALPPEIVDRVFRTTHSLKGVAGMFGLDAMSAVAHVLENILDGLRTGRFPLDDSLVDLLDRGHDCLCSLLATADAESAAVRAEAQQVIDAVAAALAERRRETADDASVLEATLSRLQPDEVEEVRRAAGAGRTVAVVGLELGEEGFEIPFRNVLAAIRTWGTVHGTASTGRDAEHSSFHCRIVTSSDDDLFGLIRAVTPLGAEVLVDEATPDLEADRVVAATGLAMDAARPAAAADPAPSTPAPEAAPAPPAAPPSFLRVPAERVERLIAEIADVVQAKARLETKLVEALAAAGVERTRVTVLRQSLRDLDGRLRAVRDGAVGMRTVRLEPLFQKLDRVFRDACRQASRDARFVVSGEATELDKQAAEALTDPLVHLVRNAVDHGIEPSELRADAGKDPVGTVRLDARCEGRRVVLEVSDDGAGIDFERVLAKARRLGLVGEDETPSRATLLDVLFHPGLTVKDEPTALSGRGVGLDVVRDSVARLGGVLDVDTGPGGTTFRVAVPASLAVVTALEIAADGQNWFLPFPNIVRALEVAPDRIRRGPDSSWVELDGERVPARGILGGSGPPTDSPRRRSAVLVAAADRRAVLFVNRLGRQQDITVRSLGDLVPPAPGIAGCAETPDGRTLLVLDVAALLEPALPGAGAIR